MIWPAEVIAKTALDEWVDKRKAMDAVAIALYATQGDDTYEYQPVAPGMATLIGAWAIPWLPEMEPLGLDPYRLRDNAKLARIMTGPDGNEWEWSAHWISGGWREKLDQAKAAVENPASGMVMQTSIPINNRFDNERTLRGIATATSHVMSQAGRALRRPPQFRR